MNNFFICHLKQNNRPALEDSYFKDSHSIFRIATHCNPVTFTFPSILTELSCNWSMLSIPGHIKMIKNFESGYIVTTSVRQIHELHIEKTHIENNEEVQHVIKCFLYHSPEKDDYSHVQIDILHYLPGENTPRRYKKNNWNKHSPITRDNRFFKDLRSQYRYELALLFEELPTYQHFKPSKEFKIFYPFCKRLYLYISSVFN